MTTIRLSDEFVDEHRDHLIAWAKACGLDPYRIPVESDIEIADGKLTVDLFTPWPRQVGPDGHVKRERVTVPLAAPFPVRS